MTVEYGTVKALHAIAERIGLIDIVNQAAPTRDGLPGCELVWENRALRVMVGHSREEHTREKTH